MNNELAHNFLPRRKREVKKNLSIKEKILKIGSIILAILLVFIIMQVSTYILTFYYIEQKVRVLTGFDTLIVKAIAFILMAIIFGTPLCGFVWSFLPFPVKNKKIKRFIFLIVLAVVCIIASIVSRNVYFNPDTGESLKYYSTRAGKYYFYSKDGYDPVTGDKLKKVTRDVALNQTNGIAPNEGVGTNELYGVLFKNNSRRNLYLCITPGNDVSYYAKAFKIPSGGKQKLAVAEGVHYFTFMDVNGNSFGYRDGGDILVTSGSQITTVFNNKTHASNSSFMLTVLAEDNQVVRVEENSRILHSTDLDSKEQEDKKDSEMTLRIIGCIFLFTIAFLFLYAFSTN